MKLPDNHVMVYNGEKLNWSVGDAISPDIIPANRQNPTVFWCFGMLNSWNSIHAKYCGRFNNRTREITDIILLKK